MSGVPGCQVRCSGNEDCGDGFCDLTRGVCDVECYSDDDCHNPPECAANPDMCSDSKLHLFCNAYGRCVGPYHRQKVGSTARTVTTNVPTKILGWDDPPGTGRAFIVDSLKIAESPDIGFNLDGKCKANGNCIENSLAPVGQLGNDQIRQGLLGGETLLLVELAGLTEPFKGDQPTLTVKFYGARDAHDPFYPAADFMIPPGETSCCEFKINPQSISGVPPQARARSPAKIERGQMLSLAPMPIQFTLTVGVPPYPEVRIERVLLSGRVPSNLKNIKDGLLGGAVPIHTLAQTQNPYCKTVSDPLCPALIPESTLIDLIVALQQPDIDIDGDGGLDTLQRDVLGNGRIKTCHGGGPSEDLVPPMEPDKPWTCALQPAMADGFSLALEFSAVAATILGVAQ
jgi:hypothetical protein